MKDASNTRRSMGKLGILTAAAIILPLTATIVPAINAQDDTNVETDAPQVVKKNVKIIKINKDGKNVHVVSNDGDGKEVTKVERDGKTFVFHTDKKLSQDEVEDMIADAEKSRVEAEERWGEAQERRVEAEASRGEAEIARGHADIARKEADKQRLDADWRRAEADVMRGQAEIARSHAEVARRQAEAMRVHAVAMSANYIPEIDISEITKNCREGQPVTTNVEGFDGASKSRVKIVMCGKGQAKFARLEAIKGLREARSEIAAEDDMPKNVRKDVLKKLEEQIRRLEAQADTN